MAPRPARGTRADAERSFEQLYRGHRGDVYRAALRELGNAEDAEDVTQAAFVDAYRAVLRGTRPQAPRAWLLTIAENVRRRRFRTSLTRPREEPLDADAALAAEVSHEQASALLESLGSLTVEQRQAFLLREIAGLSYDEIAERTGSTVGSVQMLLFRARKSLRDELEPPQVHGLLLPLVTAFSRFQGVGMVPRAAGAVGAAALALGVSSSTPAKADPPPAQPSAARAAGVVAPARQQAAPRPLAAAPVRSAAAQARAAKKRVAAPAVVPAAAPAVPVDQPHPQPAAPQASPPAELPAFVRPALVVSGLARPALPEPAELAPLLGALVDPLLESAGAAGAAGASAPPLPELPPVPVPPVP